MTVQAWTFLLVSVSFALYIGIAIWSRAGSTRDFYVAGTGVSPLANGMATAADWMSAASFISMAGLISFMGYDGSVYLLGWTGGYVLLALMLAPYLRKYGAFTVPDFVGDRYYSQIARIVAVVCAIFVSFTRSESEESTRPRAFRSSNGSRGSTESWVSLLIYRAPNRSSTSSSSPQR
jgi:cation/acetate symporter